VAETPPAAVIAPAILPGSEHSIPFHGIVKGSCWGALPGGEGQIHAASGVPFQRAAGSFLRVPLTLG
jgi:hypothetical protein